MILLPTDPAIAELINTEFHQKGKERQQSTVILTSKKIKNKENFQKTRFQLFRANCIVECSSDSFLSLSLDKQYSNGEGPRRAWNSQFNKETNIIITNNCNWTEVGLLFPWHHVTVLKTLSLMQEKTTHVIAKYNLITQGIKVWKTRQSPNF